MFTTFRGGNSGAWQVISQKPVKGQALAQVPCLSVIHSEAIALPLIPSQTAWRLAGGARHVRYVERGEKPARPAGQAARGRPGAGRAALTPTRKSAAGGAPPRGARRAIFEDKPRHIAASLKYLPA